jgi:hypothetical protein
LIRRAVNVRVVCVLVEEQTNLEALAEALLRFTPRVCIGENSVFLDIAGCQGLYTEPGLRLRIQVLMGRLGVKYRLAIATDLPTALALAVFRQNHRDLLPIDALQIYASPFKTSQSMAKVIGVFKRLGLRTLHDVKTLPFDTLAARVGKDGFQALLQAHSPAPAAWRRFVAPEKVVEFCAVDDSHGVRDYQSVLFIVKGLLDKALLRLRGRGELILEVELRIVQERHSTVERPVRTWRFDLPKPLGSSQGLLPIFHERLMETLRRAPLVADVRRLELEVLRTAPGGLRQVDFFSKKEEELESLRSIVSRLSERLGGERVFFASPQTTYTPEKGWRKSTEPVVEQLSSAISALPRRPARLLRKPMPICRKGDQLRQAGREWRVVAQYGPERLGGEWWWRESERDYYRVRVDSGEEFWIFTDDQKRCFLHGVFD